MEMIGVSNSDQFGAKTSQERMDVTAGQLVASQIVNCKGFRHGSSHLQVFIGLSLRASYGQNRRLCRVHESGFLKSALSSVPERNRAFHCKILNINVLARMDGRLRFCGPILAYETD